MKLSNQIFLSAVIIYTVMALIFSAITKIPAIHLFNTFMLSAILAHILDWKYDTEDENEF